TPSVRGLVLERIELFRLARKQADADAVLERAASGALAHQLGEISSEQHVEDGVGFSIVDIDDAKPDAIFNVLFGGDLAKLVREGTTRGTFKNRVGVSLLSGEPEYLDPLKHQAPVGRIVTGYPSEALTTPAPKHFVPAYHHPCHD